MNVFKYFRDIIITELEDFLGAGGCTSRLDFSTVAVSPPRETGHGDMATNAALVLAKAAGERPADLAARLAERLGSRPEVRAATVAGPGFVNLRIEDAFWHARLAEALGAGTSYGDSSLGAGAPVNVEYVSANPTGPLHIGHARGAVVGDALAGLLEKVGYAVTREYYINDAGLQVDQLALSAYLRYREALGEPATEQAYEALFGAGTWEYRGDYLVPVGRALADRHGDRLCALAPEEWLPVVREAAVEAMMRMIEGDLAALGVRHAVFTSERALVEAGRVEKVLATLEERGLLYIGVLDPPKGKTPEDWEPRPQTLFRATQFGDDTDRPLRKSDGSWTYFAADIANHWDKYQRGFATMINIWGADHGGYVKRMKAAVSALTDGRGALDIKLCRLVNLFEGGTPVRMSKRAGTFITLREVVDRVGKDVVRFIMLTRRNDAALDIDLVKVTEQSLDNAVFYVQYAHARAASALRTARAALPALALDDRALGAAELARLTDPDELALIRRLAAWPWQVETAAQAHEPHRVAYDLAGLAAAFHGLWSRGNREPALRFVVPEDAALTQARLALVRGVAIVIASGLRVFGVEPVEEMR